MCFVLQARPVKIALKQAFYACHHPPGILLSLLPAPQQAILSFDVSKAYQDLYGREIVEKNDEDDDEEEEEEDVDDEDDDEDEEEEDEEDDDEDDDDEDE